MNAPPCCLHQKRRAEVSSPSRRYPALDGLEIAIGSLCSVVMWEYTAQAEVSTRDEGVPGQHGVGELVGVFDLRPSPALMLFSCLLFGCCVSSFVLRRQSRDPFQFLVFVVLLGGTALAGYAVREDVHLILLGYLPWATCTAMAISIVGHSLYRRLRSKGATEQRDEEKTRLLS
ncbi:hypothetical protein N658DRAFT_441392 [Parathielavia hyrcaniae]|uniref:Uncharacterized protein n=1 Tax=Parathielavia hyrcaniae TaxID=113614 RepID=A0AAN6QBN8_9PEZI|nr:hypothetical protein N658DRAFT_441392 [Parathielavia hyrcaniae]